MVVQRGSANAIVAITSELHVGNFVQDTYALAGVCNESFLKKLTGVVRNRGILLIWQCYNVVGIGLVGLITSLNSIEAEV